ncbi:DUF6371 domain-containing protein [Flavobacterium azooxidireducens]|uniref:DUF6371 domain-containing protein n=1 Tax=Flavobacterium azooxidireducens TaxID=1871076 RepID=A0ABY4KIS3_9FLAO|nr:DUF6371 domain-containing protein [Flavobacterium azooxidireducens]UPQ80732.1 DUF6371 domain-containing protein [Flavobacterium azooxidireducens]
MEAFKYSLDKSSKKYVCPNCNKKTFVLYIDTETGNYLTTDFGRCDREQNCNYHKAPPKGKRAFLIDFITLKSISDKAYKLTDVNGIISIVPKSQILEQSKNNCWITEWFLKTSIINYLSSESKYFNTGSAVILNEVINNISLSERTCNKEPSFHSLELLDKMYFDNPQIDNLTEFLITKFSKDEVFNAKQNYFITGTNHFWNNATVFWQINNKEQIQGAKIMLYDRYTGKRTKEPYNHINWLHKAINDPNFTLRQSLFGLHRINEDYQKTIAIVESEKTAIVMSIFLPEFIWLASGSKGNFKFELLEPIKKRNVIAFPDKGEYKNWLDKATELNAFGFKIAVSDLIEQTDFENGFDLADYYFENNF